MPFRETDPDVLRLFQFVVAAPLLPRRGARPDTDEIDGAIAKNNRPRDELQALYPFIEWVSYEELAAG